MNRLLFTPPLLLITLFGTSQALAQSSLKGQGRAFTGAGVFSLTVDARGSRGTAAGSFRYDRKTNGALEELVVVAAADCLWTSIDGTRAVVSGRADVRSNPAGLATKEWFFIGIQDAGPAEKNRARAGFVSRVEGLEMCQAGSTSFPAMVDVGDFVITRDAGASVTGGGSAGGLTGTPVPGNPTAPPFDGALYLPFDGTASPGQIVTKPGATPPTFVPGKYGQAIYFNDSSAVAVPFELSPIDTPQITMTAWIKRSPGSSMGKIVSSAGTGHPVMQIYGGSVKRLRGSGGREAFNMSIDGFDIKTGQWTFIAVVLDYELKTIRLQVDDSEPQTFDRQRDGQPLRMEPNGWDVRAQSELVGPDGKKGYYVTIGARGFSSFGGVARGYAIDDVRIYTRALSEQAVAGLAVGGAAPNTAPSRYANIPVLGDPDPIGNADPREAIAKPGTSPTPGTPGLGDPRVAADDPADSLTVPEGLTPPQAVFGAEAYEETAARDAREREREAFDDEQARLQNEAEAARREAFAFGPRNRAQVVFNSQGDIAFVSIPAQALSGPGSPPLLERNMRNWTAGEDIAEIFRIQGTFAIVAISTEGEYELAGASGGKIEAVRTVLKQIKANNRPIDLVADRSGGFLVISGTEVFARNIPSSSRNWVQGELDAGFQVTALVFLSGNAWIAVSERALGTGGITGLDWRRNLLLDVKNLRDSGARIEDIDALWDEDQQRWAIATDEQVFVRGLEDPDSYSQFGIDVQASLGREWILGIPIRNCRSGRKVWDDTSMASPQDPNVWEVNLFVTIGVKNYETRDDKQIFDCWLEDSLRKAESLFDDRPRLKLNLRTERETEAGGFSFAPELRFDSGRKYANFMDRNFDIMAKTRTEGYIPILVVDRLCVGKKCIGGRASFPHVLAPFDRKYGITLVYVLGSDDDVLAHEFGHFLSLLHTFEPYKGFGRQCNKPYDPNLLKMKDRYCRSCRSGVNYDRDTCGGEYNVMDYCKGDDDLAYFNECQSERTARQRDRYQTNSGQTNYIKMKGIAGEPYCKDDSGCLSDEYCNTGVATLGYNVCKTKLDSGSLCSRGGQCASGKCPLLRCK